MVGSPSAASCRWHSWPPGTSGWGWRVPFWLSAVVVIITYYVRSHLDETPVFAEAREESAVRKLPLGDVFKYHGSSVICVAGAPLMAAMQTLFVVFSLYYATSRGVDRSVMLAVISGAIALSTFTIPAAGYLSDVIGRKRTVLVSAVGCALTLFGYLWAISTADVLMIVVPASWTGNSVLTFGGSPRWGAAGGL